MQPPNPPAQGHSRAHRTGEGLARPEATTSRKRQEKLIE